MAKVAPTLCTDWLKLGTFHLKLGYVCVSVAEKERKSEGGGKRERDKILTSY